MKAIDAQVRTFILAAHRFLGDDFARMNMGVMFSKRPVILSGRNDWERVWGLEAFHVIEFISPRPFLQENSIRSNEYNEMVARVRERWEIVRCRSQSFGNMWIQVNLP